MTALFLFEFLYSTGVSRKHAGGTRNNVTTRYQREKEVTGNPKRKNPHTSPSYCYDSEAP